MLFFITAVGAAAGHGIARASIFETIANVQPAIVKIYGAGGFRGMEPYQSGILISPDGHILTVFSYVLDTDAITATLADGREFEATLLGADPRLEVAVLKIDAAALPCFNLSRAVEVRAGARVLAFSNLFGVATGDEPASVQHGVVSVKTRLEARRGVFETAYQGPVYVLDAVTNNPGAAGGALVTRHGELVGMLGKELRSTRTNAWLNYAIPIEALRRSVEQIRRGKFVAAASETPQTKPARGLNVAMLGIELVPDVVSRTPPYVDRVRTGSAAAGAGIRPDDLVVLLDDRLVQSCKAMERALGDLDPEEPVKLTVLRGQELLEFVLQASRQDGSAGP